MEYWNFANSKEMRYKLAIISIFIILILFFKIDNIFAQIITKKNISINFDLDEIDYNDFVIDESGNYLFYNSKKKSVRLFSNSDYLEINSPSGKMYSGDEIIYKFNNGVDEELFYIRSKNSTDIYGPFKGELISQNSDESGNLISMSILNRDSIYNYINNSIISTNIKNEIKTNGIRILEVDSTSYIVSDGFIKNITITSVNQIYSSENEFKFLFVDQTSDSNYCLIQKLEEGNYRILGNNLTIDLNNISKLLIESIYLFGNQLTFYAIENNTVVQYKITL